MREITDVAGSHSISRVMRYSHSSVNADHALIARDIIAPHVREAHMSLDPFQRWICDALASQPGKTQTGLAKRLGIDPSAVSKITKGRRTVKTLEIAPAADYLGVPPPTAATMGAADQPPEADSDATGEPLPTAGDLQPPASPLVQVRIQGPVEAGRWREVNGFDDVQDEWTEEIRDPDYPEARMMAYEVVGNSMNHLKPRPIMPGDRIITVAFDDLRGRVPLRDGMVVVIEQVLNGGHLRERSVKQLELFEDHYEFHPRSTDPRHQPIIVNRDFEADDGRSVEILALVRRISNTVPLSGW